MISSLFLVSLGVGAGRGVGVFGSLSSKNRAVLTQCVFGSLSSENRAVLTQCVFGSLSSGPLHPEHLQTAEGGEGGHSGPEQIPRSSGQPAHAG